MYEKYKKYGFLVLGFPCNQFSNGEPDDNEQMKKVYLETHKVTFPLFDKVSVNGPEACPTYQWLRTHSELLHPGKPGGHRIPWSYTKFMIKMGYPS